MLKLKRRWLLLASAPVAALAMLAGSGGMAQASTDVPHAHAIPAFTCGSGWGLAWVDDHGDDLTLTGSTHGSLDAVDGPSTSGCQKDVNIESSADGELFQIHFENNGGNCATYDEDAGGAVLSEGCSGDSVNTLWYLTSNDGINSYGATVSGEPAGLKADDTTCTNSSDLSVEGGGPDCANEWSQDTIG